MSLSARGSKNHCWGTHHSEEHRKKISEGNKGKRGYWAGKKQPIEIIEKRRAKQIGHTCSLETREKISQSNSGKKRTKKQREQMSKMMATRVKENPNQHIRAKWGYFNSSKNNEQIFYRSSYELQAYHILEKDKNVISFKREALKIPYEYNGIKRFYIPDILVNYKNNQNKVIEIKAKWAIELERNKIKFREAEKYCTKNNLTFEIWTEKELKIAKQ